ncbi:MAG TPA: dUTP diphosphatase [Candidatus Cloacimonadota bacterium]|nr:dUTP diphosphatase [Candidatus Cloacimonadota bacterium]
MIVKLKKLTPQALIPQRMTPHASGYDLFACLERPLSIPPGQRSCVPTGIAVEIPPGYEGQVRPRSGLALKLGMGILNSPGTIDADYRGEIGVILINLGNDPVDITPGMRIAQLVFNPVVYPEMLESDELSPSHRDSGGFGHSGQ